MKSVHDIIPLVDQDMVRDLTIAEINNGARYAWRCRAARSSVRVMACDFAHIAALAAKEYERAFHNEGGSRFTAQEILLVASGLVEYYTNHVKEGDAVAK